MTNEVYGDHPPALKLGWVIYEEVGMATYNFAVHTDLSFAKDQIVEYYSDSSLKYHLNMMADESVISWAGELSLIK